MIYNVFDQSPEDELLPLCQERGVGVIVWGPFDEGALTGNVTPETTFNEGDFRNEYFKGDRKQEVQERVRAIVSELGIPEEKLPEIALRYILSHPAVSTIISGMRFRLQRRTQHGGRGWRGPTRGPSSEAQSHRWTRNFYPDPSEA